MLAAVAVTGATIVVPVSPAPEENQAAAELQHVWMRATGETPRLRHERTPSAADEAGPGFLWRKRRWPVSAPRFLRSSMPTGFAC